MNKKIAAWAIAALALGLPTMSAAATHGDVGFDRSFEVPSSYSSIQNLGNGNFTHGAAVTGVDVRASTTLGNMIYTQIQEHDIVTGNVTYYFAIAGQAATSGSAVYHFAFAPFTPHSFSCYTLIVSESDNTPVDFYGWSSQKYTASSAGCVYGYNSDDISSLNQNPAMNGHGIVDYSFVIYDDGNVATATPPITPTGKTYGSLNADFSFAAQGTSAALQNLGNGSFSEGNAVTGIDVRVGAVPGNLILATIREYDATSAQTNEFTPQNLQETIEGDHTYHFDFPSAFTPDPSRCYQMLSYQVYPSTYASTYYGHSTDVYHASTTGCIYGRDTDNRANLLQNPSLNAPGYIDYAFRIHTNGATSTATTTATTTASCTLNCNSNVMFLPGVGGSRLYRPARPDEAPNSQHQIWEPKTDADVYNLELNDQGKEDITSPQSEIYTRDVLDEAYVSAAGPNIYKTFMQKMDALVASSSIHEWSAVPYDWRLSLDDILSSGVNSNGKISYLHATATPYIAAELMRLASSSRTGKVTVVAHSNGGLVIKALLVAHPEFARYVDKLIFVAVPQVGTPQAVAAILHGNKQGMPSDYLPLIISAQAGREFSANAPVAYNLLPSQSYFTYVDDPVVTFDAQTLPVWSGKYGNTIHSVETLGSYLIDSYERVDKTSSNTTMPIQANAYLLAQAQHTHAILDAWIPPAGIQVIQIAGWGIPTTLKSIQYSSTTKSVFCSNFCDQGLTLTASTTVDGDGTVVVPSALWMAASIPNVKDYWVDIGSYNIDHLIASGGTILRPFNHKDILEITDLDNFIVDNISSSTKPIFKYSYLSFAAPHAVNKRLRYELHSPLTLDLYDRAGNHTGISTSTGEIEAGIPGTYYMELGGVKYLYSGTDSANRIIMSGYATGTFSFSVEQFIGDSQTAKATFKDIPTTPQTKVSLDVQSDITTVSPMRIDSNGDGNVDITLLPRIGGVTLFDTVPPEVTIRFGTTTKRVEFLGTDDRSVASVIATAAGLKVSDSYANSLTLIIQKNTAQSNYATLIIPSFSYSTGSSTNATTTIRYFWSTDKTGKYTLFISAIKTPTDRALSIYSSLVDKTYVINTTAADDIADPSLQSALLLLRSKLKTLNGLVVPQVLTKQGTMIIKY